MESIYEFRQFSLDRIVRLNNGTRHLEDFFASVTEDSLRAFVEEHMTLIEAATADALLLLELQSQPGAAVKHLWAARHRQLNLRDTLRPFMEMRRYAAELFLRLGAYHFFAGECEHQLRFWDHVDDLLIENAEELEKARSSISLLDPRKDTKLGEAIVALHDLRVVSSTLFAQHQEADHAYIAALETLTGTPQPPPVPSKLLTQADVSVPKTKTKTPPATVH